MQPSVPVPTDNIYKFAALFGIAIIISVLVFAYYLPEKYGEMAFNNNLELEILKAKDKLSPEETIKKPLLERKVKARTVNQYLLYKDLLCFYYLVCFSSSGVEYVGGGKFNLSKMHYSTYKSIR